MEDDDDYKVGYKKPPKATQFQKGRSGSPRGRPKKKQDTASVIREVFTQEVTTHGPNGSLRMTKWKAGLTQIANEAASGDVKAFREMARLAEQYPELVQESQRPPNFWVELYDTDENGKELNLDREKRFAPYGTFQRQLADKQQQQKLEKGTAQKEGDDVEE